MSETEAATCVGCGEAAPHVADVKSCDGCLTRITAVLALLQPSLVPEPERFSTERRGALRRVREIGKWAAEAAAVLARDELPDDQVAKLVEKVNGWWADTVGSKAHQFAARNELIALVGATGIEVHRGTLTEDGALRAIVGFVVDRWPEYAKPTLEPFRKAVREWAADESGQRPHRKWAAVTDALAKAHLITTAMDRESVRQEFYRWLREQSEDVSNVLGIKQRKR
jgi:hypothetical protein